MSVMESPLDSVWVYSSSPRWSPVVSALNGACQGAGDRRVSVLWGFPLCRYKEGEGLVVVLKEEGEGVDIKEFFKLKSNEILPNSHLFKVNFSAEAPEEFETAKGYVEISSLPSSDFTRALDFVIDVLLAFTSPSFLGKALNEEWKSTSDMKTSLFELRKHERPDVPERARMRTEEQFSQARKLLFAYNTITAAMSMSDMEGRTDVEEAKLNLFCKVTSCCIIPPFQCDYGYNIHWGKGGFVNSGATFLDCGLIFVGDNVLIGPNVDVYSVGHPLDAASRQCFISILTPVFIGNNVWIGGRCVIVPGVRIGDNAVVAAGSVVVKDVPANSVVAGNPARIVKMIEQ